MMRASLSLPGIDGIILTVGKEVAGYGAHGKPCPDNIALRLQAQADPLVDLRKARVDFFKGESKFPFMATRKVWYTLSAILMIGSIVSFATRGLNLGIDFTGGF